MRHQDILFILAILLIIVLLVVITANMDVLFPTPSPLQFAKNTINSTGAA